MPTTSSKENQSLPLWVIATWLVGLALTALLTLALQNYQSERLQDRFDNEVLRVVDDIKRRFKLPIYGLMGARGVYAASEEISRAEFLKYVESRDLGGEFPGVRGMGFIERVPRTELNAFVERERADGAPDFAIRSLSQAEQLDLYVIKYIEPLASNRSAQGLDIGSEVLRREGAERAARTGQPALSGVIQLVQDQLSRPGFLLYVPVYRPGLPLDTPEQRLAALRGLTYSPIVLHELLQPAENLLLSTNLHISIVDQTVGQASKPLFSIGTTNENAWLRTERPLTTDFMSGLVLRAHTTPAFEATANRWLVYGLGMSGLILSSLLAWVLWLQVTGRARAESRAQRMTVDLQKLAMVAQHTANSVLMLDAQGRITSINESFTRIAGYTQSEVIGERLGSRVRCPETDQATVDKIDAALADVGSCRVEILNRSKQGRLYWLDVEVQPLFDPQGQHTGFMSIESDITQRRETLDNLKLANLENQSLMSAIDQGTIYSVADLKGNIIDINDEFVRISGYTREELIGANHRLLNSGSHAESFWENVWATISAGQIWRGEVCNRAKSGSLYWVNSTIVPFIGVDGLVEKYVSIRTDITATKLAQLEIEAQQKRLNNILQGTNVGTWEWHIPTGHTLFNERWAEIAGYTLHELEPVSIDTWMRLAHPDDLQRSSDALQRHFSGELDYYECESRMRHKDGHWVWVLDRGQVASWEADGSPSWMFGTHQDITLRKETEVRIARSEALLDRTSQIAKVGAWRVDLETGTPEWSAETCRIHEVPVGYQPTMEEAINFYAPEARPVIADLVNKGMQTGEPWDVELPFVTAKGRHIWVRTLGEVEFQQGKPMALVGGFQDTTDRKEIARLQSEARERAEQASLAKSAFLANMSHEIRTPLNAILGMHRMLQGTDLVPSQSSLLGKANQAGHALMDIINDVLDLAKIEAGELSMSAQPFQPKQLFDELVDVHGVVAQAKGLKLTLDTAADLPLWIVGDRFRLRQVLSNLLSNAIKFTTTGAVTLSTRVRRDATQPWVELVVRDSGVGISEEAIGRLFTPFVQADDSTTRQFGGTGLGLSIVRNLAQMMGGDAQVSSTLGVGSEFLITLPLVEADEHVVAQATRASRPIEVALMCADEDMCLDMRQRLTALGWTCFRPMAAETGEPDVLLMDAALGSEGAVKLCEMVDASKAQGHDLPAIVLGDAQELVAMESLALPLHRVVQKPADMSRIFNSVVEVLALGEDSQDRLIGSTRAIEGGIRWLEGARILVVDDSEINLEIAVALLEQQGASCHTCVNGQEAADWLRVHHAEVDAVLMDVQMPVLDGLAATRLIKSNAALKRLPVIALTAGALDSERLRAKAAGMDDFLTKPLEPLAVVKLLRNKIDSYRGKAPLVALGQSDEAAASVDPPSSQPWPEIPGIDTTLAKGYSSNSVVLFNKLLTLVRKNYSTWGVTWLELAHQKGAGINADLCASLHKLRGSAGVLGATELAAVAEQAETGVLNGKVLPLEAVPRVAKVLDDLLAHVDDHISALAPIEIALFDAGPLTQAGREKLVTLAGLLSTGDFDAIDLGLVLRPELVSLLGQDDAKGLLQKIDGLDFNAAHGLLMNQLQQPGVAV